MFRGKSLIKALLRSVVKILSITLSPRKAFSPEAPSVLQLKKEVETFLIGRKFSLATCILPSETPTPINTSQRRREVSRKKPANIMMMTAEASLHDREPTRTETAETPKGLLTMIAGTSAGRSNTRRSVQAETGMTTGHRKGEDTPQVVSKGEE